MFVLGHIGIPVGAAWLAERFLRSRGVLPSKNAPASAWGIVAQGPIPYLWLAAGSMLPDVIDKPLGLFILSEVLGHNGRTLAHSGLFSLAPVLGGLAVLRLGRGWWLMALGLGAASHLVLDLLWSDPQTLLWPFLSWRFRSYESEPDLSRLVALPFTDLYTSLGELVGGVVLVAFFARLWRAQRASDSAR